MAEQLDNNIQEIQSQISLGGGAQFWVYISPQRDTPGLLKQWKVTFQQEDGNWQGSISSDNPQQILKTPGLSGKFMVTAEAAMPEGGPFVLTPLQGSTDEIGCKDNCAAMVGLVALGVAEGANYWTVWDAMCAR
jgi:hypothetical protein